MSARALLAELMASQHMLRHCYLLFTACMPLAAHKAPLHYSTHHDSVKRFAAAAQDGQPTRGPAWWPRWPP